MSQRKEEPLEQLFLADPDLAEWVAAGLEQKAGSVSPMRVAMLVEETLWGLSQEVSFGHAIATGYIHLVGEESERNLGQYCNLVREAGRTGPMLGRLMATYLVPVLKYGDGRLLESFRQTVDVMLEKGAYTLQKPLESLSSLLNQQDVEAGSVYLDLLCVTFSQDLSYGQCQHFSYTLPKAVLAFSSSRRVWQIEQLQRVIAADFRLADPFLEGLENRLYLLSKGALSRFVSLGLAKLKQDRKLAEKFLSLESKLGIDTFADMQVTVPISQVQHQLNRYLRARTGLPISVRPLSSLSKAVMKEYNKEAAVLSDGKFIYLPGEISTFAHKSENIKLYKCLARLEAGYYEFGTFDFDLERAMERFRRNMKVKEPNSGLERTQIVNFKSQVEDNLSDLDSFFLRFPVRQLASDLFAIFEHGRIGRMLSRHYPGIVRETMPMVEREAMRIFHHEHPVEVVFLLYVWIAIGPLSVGKIGFSKKTMKVAKKIVELFENAIAKDDTVETSAELVIRTYQDVSKLIKKRSDGKSIEEFYRPMKTPFDRRIRPDLFFETYRNFDCVAEKIRVKLKENGFSVYKTDIKRRLIDNNGTISQNDIKEILFCSKNDLVEVSQHPDSDADLSWLDLSNLLGDEGRSLPESDEASCPVFWHKEWDCNIGDYLHAHVRVLDRFVTGCEGHFYADTLEQYRGLVKRIRYAFELLKPEGLKRLRQWVEGDEFDYRALIDFAIDKKAGWLPSDRLYIKRLKQHRDVAALLLVDLSRSTANTVFGSKKRVLDVEKEAVVLFCEALAVVGDAFAVAGFSGTGRLGVDYFRIKDFDEEMDDSVKHRINGVAPLRSTRMGAAIRHATSLLENVSSKVRLLIILGDGFPNDLDYKKNYAIEDTRKAIFEARSKKIYAHAITVNISGDSRLNDLYGNDHYNVISDVQELPDRLLRIYSALTR
ncbi:nitric oxide reductase activation protein NorD [Thermodesulfobacteriota bacterium]